MNSKPNSATRAARGSIGGGLVAGLLIGLNAVAEAERQRNARDAVIGLPPARGQLSEYFQEAWDRIAGPIQQCGLGDPYTGDLGEIGQLFRFIDRDGNKMIAYRSGFMDVCTLTFKDLGLDGAVFANRTALRSFERGIRRTHDPLGLSDVRELLEVVPLQCAQRSRGRW